MIIEKNKIKNGVHLGLAILLFLIFNSLALFAWIQSEEIDLKSKLIISFFALISFLILTSNIKMKLRKLLSNDPEFEISNTQLIIYDNSNYSTVKLSDIEQVEIIKWRRDTFIGIGLNSKTNLQGNLTETERKRLKLPTGNYRWLLFDLSFAKIKPEEFKIELEKSRIKQNMVLKN
ncbi:hypothetical protein KFE94_12650 [bacterium SCSIO 12643]|nr:hypothetical protein KFE94_12650 [bacterium SCSIO 12643]